jgi:hypothetical protein
MASLTAHLRRPEDHARLAFHPQCPHCREERLSGRLPIEPVVSRRTQAAVTAAVLALTSVAPTAALATEGDQEFEGGAAAEEVTAGAGELDIDVAANDLEQDAGVAPAEAGADDGSAAPAVPVSSGPVAEPEPAAVAPASPDDADPAEAAPAPAPSAVPAETTVGAAPAAPSAPSTAPKAKTIRRARTHKRVKRVPRPPAARNRAAPRVVAVAPVASVPSTAVAATTTVRTRSAPGVATPARAGRSARRGDDSHVVLRGESLWSIAGDLVGDDASPARVAREVNRLWQLNDDRIGTGDRDLLMAGTKLELT